MQGSPVPVTYALLKAAVTKIRWNLLNVEIRFVCCFPVFILPGDDKLEDLPGIDERDYLERTFFVEYKEEMPFEVGKVVSDMSITLRSIS